MDEKELVIIDHSKRQKLTYEPWELSLLKLFEGREPVAEEPCEITPVKEPEHSVLPEAFGALSILSSIGGIALVFAGFFIPAAGCAVLAAAAAAGIVVAE